MFPHKQVELESHFLRAAGDLRPKQRVDEMGSKRINYSLA